MIAGSSSGKSFRALAAYLATGRSGEEQERVAWTASRNLPTSDPVLAATFMRATAAQSDRIEKPVYHVVLSFDPTDRVDRTAMERVADRVLERLGLTEHQAVIVAHRDRARSHLHLLVNRVHPETGKAWERWKDQPVIQQVLREEERELGLREVPGRLASLQPNEKSGPEQAPARGEIEVSPLLRRLAQDLASYEGLVEFGRRQFQAHIAATADRTRIEDVQAATQRAHPAQAGFRNALASVYQNPEEADRAFREAAERRGVLDAARSMREHPEEFGRLVTADRVRFGFARVIDDQVARAAAPNAARKGRETMEAERSLSALQPTAEVPSNLVERDGRRGSGFGDLARLPHRGELELRIARSLDRLLPRELYRLKALITSPQAALAERLRSTAREILLGREEERGA
jgi:hypothetical protein